MKSITVSDRARTEGSQPFRTSFSRLKSHWSSRKARRNCAALGLSNKINNLHLKTPIKLYSSNCAAAWFYCAAAWIYCAALGNLCAGAWFCSDGAAAGGSLVFEAAFCRKVWVAG